MLIEGNIYSRNRGSRIFGSYKYTITWETEQALQEALSGMVPENFVQALKQKVKLFSMQQRSQRKSVNVSKLIYKY